MVTMNRSEKMNTLMTATFTRPTQTLRDVALDQAVGVVVVAGAGRDFCASGDAARTGADTRFAEATLEDRPQTQCEAMDCARLPHEMPKPSIARTRGPIPGAGMSIPLSCDLRVR